MFAAQTTPSVIIVWCLILIGGIVVLGAIVWRIRRWSLNSPSATSSGEMWTLQELREMRDAGEISDREFQALKAQVLQKFHVDDQ